MKSDKGLKTFSNWPTIPQLYVGGEFVGGADILTEHVSGWRITGTS